MVLIPDLLTSATTHCLQLHWLRRPPSTSCPIHSPAQSRIQIDKKAVIARSTNLPTPTWTILGAATPTTASQSQPSPSFIRSRLPTPWGSSSPDECKAYYVPGSCAMSRNKALTVLQKTYDDSYLSCSTAVYHESQVCPSFCIPRMLPFK